MQAIAKAVRLAGVEVRITATLPEVLASRLTVQPMGGLTALSLQPVRLSGGQVVAKFTFDIVMSALLLLLLSPLLVGISIAVRLTSPGPVLYRQRRIGLRGKPVHDAEVPHDAHRARIATSTRCERRTASTT